jgi:hypothetical protein
MMLVAEPSTAWWNTASRERLEYRRQYDAQPEAHAKKLARSRRYYNRHRERRLAVQRMYNYKCTPEAYQMMVEAQGGKCAICNSPEVTTHKGRLRQLSVDHDHLTGRIRALLCGACNTGLGSLQHDPTFLEAAIAYLDAHAGDR